MPDGPLLCPAQVEVNNAIRRLMDAPCGDQQAGESDQEQRAEAYWRLLGLWAEATQRGNLTMAA
ncbi:hypothetical protein OG292_16545 [Streptomyces sp. NBC_01511]|uniref:hypothetical protein n=1 Tax=unclassified Streptomyces TaxID=2593676 RepID=UPI0038703719